MSYPSLADLQSMVVSSLVEYSILLFPDDMIVRALNDAQMDIAVKGLCIEAAVEYTTVANSRLISTQSTILTTDDGIILTTDGGAPLSTADSAEVVKVLGVEYVPTTGTRRGLLPITPMQLGHIPTKSVEPEFFFRWGRYVGIEPKPTTNYELVIYVAQSPFNKLITPTDIPEIPAAYIPFMIDYAVSRCLIRMRKFQTGFMVYNEYVGRVKRLRRTITAKYAGKAEDTLIPDLVVSQ